MSEERRAAPAPDATVPDLGPSSSTSEVAAPSDSDADKSDARRAQRDSSPAARRRARMTLRIPDDEVARPTQAVTSEPPPATQTKKSVPPPAAQIAKSVPPPAAPTVKSVPPPAAPVAKSVPPPAPEPLPAPEPPPAVLKPMRIITINPPPAGQDALDGRSYPPEAETREQLPSEEIPIDTDAEAPPPSEPAESIDPIEAESPPPPPARPLAPTEPEGEDVAFDDEVPAAAAAPAPVAAPAPAAAPARPATSTPPKGPAPSTPPAAGAPATTEAPSATGERASDPGSEVDAEDMVAEEPPLAAKALPPPVKKATAPAPAPAKPPLVIVPPHMGTIAPQRHETEGSGLRRKGRLWWEDLFNDDFLRTSEKLTDEQIAREVDFIEDSLSIEKSGAMLDLACGTGRHAIELARRGYEVVGFDLSLAMLARAGDEAQDRDAKLTFVQGDMRDMTFEEQFDGVYCWNTSFGYFEEDRNAQVIDRIHGALKAEGRLLLDVANRDFLVRQSPSLAWFEGDGCVCMDEMAFDFITSRMRVKRTVMLDDGRSREIEYSMRVYSLHELGKLLHDHGFKVCEVSGRLATPGVFFGNESPRTIILAEKR
jgi:SAM-dependent methyltransferase